MLRDAEDFFSFGSACLPHQKYGIVIAAATTNNNNNDSVGREFSSYYTTLLLALRAQPRSREPATASLHEAITDIL